MQYCFVTDSDVLKFVLFLGVAALILVWTRLFFHLLHTVIFTGSSSRKSELPCFLPTHRQVARSFF